MTDIDNSLPKAQVIEGSKHSWELVVGMEVHAQIKSKAKLFSSASTNFGSEPNSNVSIVDAAMPGMLPRFEYVLYRTSSKNWSWFKS